MTVVFVAVHLRDYEVVWSVAAHSEAERDKELKAYAVEEWKADPDSEDWSVISEPMIDTEGEATSRYKEILHAIEEIDGSCIVTSKARLGSYACESARLRELMDRYDALEPSRDALRDLYERCEEEPDLYGSADTKSWDIDENLAGIADGLMGALRGGIESGYLEAPSVPELHAGRIRVTAATWMTPEEAELFADNLRDAASHARQPV